MASNGARSVVMKVLANAQRPLTTRELYAMSTQKLPAATTVPQSTTETPSPRPQHPIQSLTALKRRVLPDLVARLEVKKAHVKGSVDSTEALKGTSSWVWQLTSVGRQAAEGLDRTPAPKEQPKTHAEMYPVPTNIHLNARRRRARSGKVKREQEWITQVAAAVASGKDAASHRSQQM
ncbi:hypothetical protein FRB99_006482 [Tulasnella sp. 403]|nr:hypothetical protein FRB99_006482 [Tulasnella sp. 403]